MLANEHHVHDDTKGEQVGAKIQDAPSVGEIGLLRREEDHGADRANRIGLIVQVKHKAHVQKHKSPVRGASHDVVRLYVAMDLLKTPQGIERMRHFQPESHYVLDRPIADAIVILIKSFAVDQLL